MTKIVYIVSHIDKANEFEWLIDRIDRRRFEISFISIHEKDSTSLASYCEKKSVPFYHVRYLNKKSLFSAILKTFRILKKIQPDAVHAHLFEGGFIGITAAWLARIRHRLYTRHYSNYHHKYFPNGLKYDRWINKRSTKIVSISKVVSSILVNKENVPEEKIVLIHHGFPVELFGDVAPERTASVRERHGIPENKVIIGVIARYTYWKGVQDIIPAFQKINAENPNTHLVLANANGDYSKEIKHILSNLPEKSYTEITFEPDNAALFKCFDIFVHTPVDKESEAFGQIYIEALLSGLPCVFTLSGVANEIIINGENAMVVDYENSQEICQAICNLLESSERKKQLAVEGKKVASSFTISKKILELEKLYSEL
ncbi:MAG: glycosyltransferase family 4 protein [Brumimicrobium sp.]|nr:glycosyltransferase family 4 protein [Brumimicrobium sp.]